MPVVFRWGKMPGCFFRCFKLLLGTNSKIFFSEMPRTYERRTDRGSWTENDLQNAFKAVKQDGMTVYKASQTFNIPEKTLRRRLLKNDDKKHGLGPKGVLGTEIEQKLANHIKKLQAAAFCPTVTEVRILAYKLAERYNLKHNFNRDKMMAGYDWFYKFLQRNPDISVRKAEGLSLSRAQGLTREDADAYFNILKSILVENNLLDKPGNIYNVDETGLPLNNKPGYVLAEKGSKDVHKLTSGEKGENITAIVCCNAEGNFLPPVCIFKGVNKKAEWEDKMPPGSYIVMSKKSSYVNTEIFSNWLENHFIPRKAQGKCLLILDGHTSHTSADKLLDLAASNDIILLCLPSHSTHFLQPLDRCFFKSLKHFWYQACQQWMDNHSFPSNLRKLGRAQMGELLSSAWSESATAKNGIVSFEATGIFPFNPKAIPSRAFVGSNEQHESQPQFFKQKSSSKRSCKLAEQCGKQQPQVLSQPCTSQQSLNLLQPIAPTVNLPPIHEEHVTPPTEENAQPTPTKVLIQISPVPVYEKRKPNKRRQEAQVLTATEVIEEKKNKREKKEASKASKNHIPSNSKKALFKKKSTSRKGESSSDDDTGEDEIPYQESDDEDFVKINENECTECLEEYTETSEKCDWIKCIVCNNWLHETCSKFLNKCAVCGRAEILLKRKEGYMKNIRKKAGL